MTALAGGGRTKRGNFLLLAAAFGAGQGAVFLAQTHLVATGDLALLSQFGVHFAFAILALMLLDWGGGTVLARETARDANPDIWAAYWPMTAFRLLVGLLTGIAALSLVPDEPFTRAYVLAALPVALIWPFNFTGLLDGLRMSGIGGLSAVPPYLTSAAMLVAAIGHPPETAGFMLGGAFTMGCLLAVLIQLLALYRAGHAPRWARPRLTDIALSARDGAGALLTTLPGQIQFRLQLLLSLVFLGPAATAIFLYARQIIAAFAQMIGFLRRVEFPDLAADPAANVLRVQRTGTAAALAVTILVAFAGLTLAVQPNSAFAQAGLFLAIFAPTILTGALALAAIQGLNARGDYRMAAAVTIGAAGLAVLASTSVAVLGHIAVFAIAEICANLAAAIAALLVLRRRTGR